MRTLGVNSNGKAEVDGVEINFCCGNEIGGLEILLIELSQNPEKLQQVYNNILKNYVIVER